MFVPLTAPGDTARVKLVKVAKNYAYGRLEELLSPRPLPGGAGLPPIRPVRGLLLPAHLLPRGAGAESPAGAGRPGAHRWLCQPAPAAHPGGGGPGRLPEQGVCSPLGTGKDGQLTMGFYAVNSHRIVDCPSCRLQPPEFTSAMEAFRAWRRRYNVSVYDEAAHQGLLRRLYLRKAFATGEVMACVGGKRQRPPLRDRAGPGPAGRGAGACQRGAQCKPGQDQRGLWGRSAAPCGGGRHPGPSLRPDLPALPPLLLPGQPRPGGASLRKGGGVRRPHRGRGAAGPVLRHRHHRPLHGQEGQKALGVEIIPQAVENARENAARNHIHNARFLCGDAAQAAAELERSGERSNVVVIDPPRKGCSPDLVQTIAAMAPRRVVYVLLRPGHPGPGPEAQ